MEKTSACTKLKLFGKMTAFALAIVCALSGVLSAAAAGTQSDSITGNFHYPVAANNTDDVTGKFYYRDSYFNEHASKYNSSLATMSLCMELSAWPSNREPLTEEGYRNKSRNFRELCSRLGFGDVEVNENYTKKPTEDSIGAAVAKKKITSDGENYNLVVLALRGGGYESEWASNLLMGTKNGHQGFENSAAKVKDFLKDYLSRNVTGKTKLWIVGYSRGGAVAGLTAKWYDDNLSSLSDSQYSISKEDIYTYTFESPQGAMKTDVKNADGTSKEAYSNIHNIVNPADIVTKLAPSAWGFARPGNDVILPADKSYPNYQKLMANMLTNLRTLENKVNYNVDSFKNKALSITSFSIVDDKKEILTQAQFLDKFTNIFANEIVGSREAYAKEYQEACSYLAKVLMSSDDKTKNAFGETLGKLIMNNKVSIGFDVFVSRNENALSKYISKSFDNAKIAYSKEIPNAVSKIIVKLLLSHPEYAATLYVQISSIFETHYPEICLAWLMSFDSNYVTASEKSASVTVNGETVDFSCFADAWTYANQNCESKIKLYADVTAKNVEGSNATAFGEGEFFTRGSNKGTLYVRNCITLDLNGHTINRNQKNAVEDGSVFIMDKEAGRLEVIDSSGKKGVITGGNTTGNGGAFYDTNASTAENKLSRVTFENVVIKGNHANGLGGGIYFSESSAGNGLILNNCEITNNTAGKNGGGIYCASGKIYTADVTVKGNVQITENTVNGTANNATLTDNAIDKTVFKIDNSFSSGSRIGVNSTTSDRSLDITNGTKHMENCKSVFTADFSSKKINVYKGTWSSSYYAEICNA